MLIKPFCVSSPDVDRARELPRRLPSVFNVNFAARDEYLGKDGLNGVTQCVKARITSSAVKNEVGISKGKAAANAEMVEGLEWCSDLLTLAEFRSNCPLHTQVQRSHLLLSSVRAPILCVLALNRQFRQ